MSELPLLFRMSGLRPEDQRFDDLRPTLEDFAPATVEVGARSAHAVQTRITRVEQESTDDA